MRVCGLLLGLLVAGCGSGSSADSGDGDADADADADTDADTDADGDGDVDPTDRLFDPTRLIEVAIELEPADWAALRDQTRSIVDVLGGDCLDAPFGSPFTYFPATVTIDGETLSEIGVRKKGFLGSLDSLKPALKLKFDEYVADQRLSGDDGMTLNNAKQDPSYLHQCLTYALFDAAGVPASRCNFAHVTVNGEDLGLYVHVESVDKDLLERRFDSDLGNLYEGTLSDFREGWLATFDRKTNETDLDRSDLQAVVDALEAPDDLLEDSLSEVIDLDEFIRFWVMEVLTNHWDGYASNANNFFVYRVPSTGLFTFLPWGTDGTLVAPQGGSAAIVIANVAIAHRLYGVPATRDRYLTTLVELLELTWDPSALVAEVDRMEELITPIADPDGSRGLAVQVDAVRYFVRSQREWVEAALALGTPSWDQPMRDPLCFDEIGHVTGTFETTWGTVDADNPFVTGSGTLEITVDGESFAITLVGAKAGYDPNSPPGERANVQVIAALEDGTYAGVSLVVRPEAFVPGGEPVLDFDTALGAVFSFDPTTATGAAVGLFGGGTLHFEEASMQDGGAVSGTFDAPLWEWLF